VPYRLREIELARRIQTGDEVAFNEFANLFGSRLLQYSMVLCRQKEDAEEIVQETLMTLHQRVSDLRDAERVRPWAFRIAKNACLMKRRKGVFEPPQCDLVDVSEVQTITPSKLELLASVSEALRELPQNLRMVFLLRIVEELSTEETADALEISVDAVKNRLRRARGQLRSKLGDRNW
jgi:RNA polymerase sigma-70 factor (ECF subfamily)